MEKIKLNTQNLEVKSKLNSNKQGLKFFQFKKRNQAKLEMTNVEFANKNMENNVKNSKSLLYERKELKRCIKILLKEVLYNSLSQAIIKIFQTPYIALKVFLIIFVLISSGITSYLVVESCIEYFSYGVSTTSRTLYENPTLFPKVTFCNVNWFTTEYAYNLTQMNVTFGQVSSFSNEEKQKLGHDLNDILFECKFNYDSCNSSDFVWSFDPDYGNCYTFNSGFDSNGNRVNLKKSSIAGPDFGLKFTLYVNVYEGLLDVTNDVDGLGALIRIGNSSY